MEKEQIINAIISNVGGKENIINSWHCMTRLRFDLKDKNKVNLEEIKKVRRSGRCSI